MSRRSSRLLLGVLLAVVVVSGVAFAATFQSTLAWQQRDEVTATVTDYALVDDGEAIAVAVTVDNPLSVPLESSTTTVTVYPSGPPYPDEPVTDGRRATVSETTVSAGGSAVVTVTVPIKTEQTERATAVVQNGSAAASGSIKLELGDRRFDLDVGAQ
ncbi:MAG: hypothetical protein ABEH80_09125 [Halobaculum sp.]